MSNSRYAETRRQFVVSYPYINRDTQRIVDFVRVIIS